MTEFCKNFTPTWAIDFAHWFLLAALIAAVLTVAIDILGKILALRGGSGVTMANDVPSVLDSTAKLIDSLVKAPMWFALFLAGLALLWVSPIAVTQACPQAPGQHGSK